jgi:hypothetical protein
VARADTQSVPGNLQADYARAFGPTGYLYKNYGKKDWERSCIQSHYPPNPSQSDHPSIEQLQNRTIFQEACAGWQDTTANERAAYFDLSNIVDYFYFDFFMSRTLLALHAGKLWEELARPNATRYDLENGDGSGAVVLQLPGPPENTIDYDFETDPVSHDPPKYPFILTAQALAIVWWDDEQSPPVPALISQYPFTTLVRTRFQGSIEWDPEWPTEYRITAGIYRASSDLTPRGVVWRIGTDGGDDTNEATLTNFRRD